MSKVNGELLDAALCYAELGYAVFPCVPGSKVPLTEHGFKDATIDTAQIEAWWSERPNANIGIPTARLVVVDIDRKDNAWPEDPDEAQELASGPLSLTPRGGRHHLFRQPTGKAWRNTTSKLARKVDTRADGGYIVAPPSIRDGKTYRWAEGYELDGPPESLPEPPTWLVQMLDQCHGSPSVVATHAGDNIIPDGQRNSTLASLAGTMRRVGMGHAEIHAALILTNTDRCNPPLPTGEVENIVTSICRYKPDQKGVVATENDWAQDPIEDCGKSTPDIDPGPIPEHLFRVPGLIAKVMDFTMANAPYPNIGLAFCGAVALQSYLCGRKVRTVTDLRPNIYVLALASSGTGKDFPRKVNSRVLFEIGQISALGDKFASGQGIPDALLRSNAMLFQNDEMDGVLRQINFDRENKHESIPNILLTLYTSANDLYPMRVKANQKEAAHIDQPHLTLFGTATPQYFYEALNQRMLTNGLFARMIVVDIDHRGRGQLPGSPANLPEEILRISHWWADFEPGRHLRGNLYNVHPEPSVVPFTPKSAQALQDLQRMSEDEWEKANDAGDEPARTAWSRTCENATRLALLYACSENHEDPAIGLSGVQWATEFAMHQTRRQLYLATMYVATTGFEGLCKKALRFIKQCCRVGEVSDSLVPDWKLRRHLAVNPMTYDSIIEALEKQKQIIFQTIPGKTKPRSGWKLT